MTDNSFFNQPARARAAQVLDKARGRRVTDTEKAARRTIQRWIIDASSDEEVRGYFAALHEWQVASAKRSGFLIDKADPERILQLDLEAVRLALADLDAVEQEMIARGVRPDDARDHSRHMRAWASRVLRAYGIAVPGDAGG